MKNCSDIDHVWGYNQNGKWVEQYKSGDLILFQNYPPEGQHSQTPVATIGTENGWCYVEDVPVANDPQTLRAKSQEQGSSEVAFGMGTLFLIVVVGEIAFRAFRYRQRQQTNEPIYLHPWENEGETEYLKDQYPDGYASEDEGDLEDARPHPPAPVRNPYKSVDTGRHEGRHSIDTRTDTIGFQLPDTTTRVEARVDTELLTPDTVSADWPDRHLQVGDAIFDSHLDVVYEFVPKLCDSVAKILPFDSTKDPQVFEFESFREVKNADPDLGIENVILVMWRVRKSSTSPRYLAARERYTEFVNRIKSDEEKR